MPITQPGIEAVEQLVLNVLRRMNEDLPASERLPERPDTVLMGEGGLLDSLGIANFIVAIEEGVEQEFGRAVALSDQDLSTLFEEPSVTVAGFAAHVAKRLNS